MTWWSECIRSHTFAGFGGTGFCRETLFGQNTLPAMMPSKHHTLNTRTDLLSSSLRPLSHSSQVQHPPGGNSRKVSSFAGSRQQHHSSCSRITVEGMPSVCSRFSTAQAKRASFCCYCCVQLPMCFLLGAGRAPGWLSAHPSLHDSQAAASSCCCCS